MFLSSRIPILAGYDDIYNSNAGVGGLPETEELKDCLFGEDKHGREKGQEEIEA